MSVVSSGKYPSWTIRFRSDVNGSVLRWLVSWPVPVLRTSSGTRQALDPDLGLGYLLGALRALPEKQKVVARRGWLLTRAYGSSVWPSFQLIFRPAFAEERIAWSRDSVPR